MIARGALERRESRGAHWRSDHPHLAAATHTETSLAELRAAQSGRVAAEEVLTP
ncbi:hypothetical protein ACU4GA_15690 [Methylobacterium oryzae CBMB20]